MTAMAGAGGGVVDIEWTCAAPGQAPADLVYRVLALRCAVFVVEQQCAYLDPDGLDAAAWWLVGRDAAVAGGPVLAHARLFGPGLRYEEASIGRVCTAAPVRGTGLGRRLVAEAIRRCEAVFGAVPIRISAQAHLADFYAGFGFVVVSAHYDEDGIPHLAMRRPAGA